MNVEDHASSGGKESGIEHREGSPLKDWVAGAEVAMLGTTDTAAERFAWLARGLLRHAPEKLWGLLREASREELSQVPEADELLTTLGQRLVEADRLHDAEDLLRAATRWEIRLGGAAARSLAQASARAGATARVEEILRDLLKRDAGDVDAIRMLYRLLRDVGRGLEGHRLLNRLVDLEATAATATFAHRERVKLGAAPGRPVRIALLSSYVADPIVPFLDAECRQAGLAPEFYVGPFNQYTQEILNPSSGLYAFAPEITFLALDLEDLFPDVRRMPSTAELTRARKEIRIAVGRLVRELCSRTGALVVVHEPVSLEWSPHGLLDNRRVDGLLRWVEDLNRDLVEEIASQPQAYVLPLRLVLSRVGAERSVVRKLHYMARMRHGDAALREIARYGMRYIKPLKGLTRKCVVVDLDGTLWGGVVGEVGPEGIQLGPTAPGVEFADFQEALLNLTKRGILLAICSKNNPEDVMPVLREHKHMVLREEHFSATRINWRNKAENIAEIAEELNIGLDALVFLDDNPVERELVRRLLPEVLTVDLPRDASQLRSTLEGLPDFELLALTREDEFRVSQYQANRRRQALEQSSGSLDEYLRSLEIRAAIARAESHHVPRLVQMFNKTNQFNTTTRRHQLSAMERFVVSPDHQVYVLEVSDRFGEHGVVGAAIVRQTPEAWHVDGVLLSCRVMGLSVETALLERICDAARESGVHRLVGEFIPTPRNGPTADFYPRHGFRREQDVDGAQLWVLDPVREPVERPAWLAMGGSAGA